MSHLTINFNLPGWTCIYQSGQDYGAENFLVAVITHAAHRKKM